MKVYVTQGHEKGIGLEVFFKAVLFHKQKHLNDIKLLAFKETVDETIKSLRLPFKLHEEFIEICHLQVPVVWLRNYSISQSLTSLDFGMKLAESGGVLYTLPTSKDQLNGHAGHTEYFRKAYRLPDLGMFFSSPTLKMLLVTDHVPVQMLSEILTEDKIQNTVAAAHKTLKSWKFPHSRFLISGLNPHAGEQGIIGTEDTRVTRVVNRLADKSEFEVSGPFPGDTMLRERKSQLDILVYLFHDQGLGLFKGLQGLVGSNITLGLPYPRLSPDHGTSFNLFGKNQADYRGCSYSLREALDMLKRINGQDTSNQGQGS